MDANVSTMTMPKTMPVQNLCRYISFYTIHNFSSGHRKEDRCIGVFCFMLGKQVMYKKVKAKIY